MHDHISTHLKALHWLPVKHRITFKLSTISYKAIRHQKPAYLAELLVNRPCTRNLRSSSMDLLTVPRTRTITCDRAFSCAAPAAWNNISVFTKSADSLNTFKSGLKTELFRSAYWQYSFFASDSFAILGWQLQLQLQLQLRTKDVQAGGRAGGCADGWTNGRTYGRTCGRAGGWTNGPADGSTDVHTNGRGPSIRMYVRPSVRPPIHPSICPSAHSSVRPSDGRTDGWAVGQMDGWIGGRRDGLTNGRTNGLTDGCTYGRTNEGPID